MILVISFKKIRIEVFADSTSDTVISNFYFHYLQPPLTYAAAESPAKRPDGMEPCTLPPALDGVILSTGRIAGETAALIYTAGTMATLPKNLLSSGRTLAVHMYVLSQEGLHTDQAFATAVILLVMVLLINILSSVIAKKMQRD